MKKRSLFTILSVILMVSSCVFFSSCAPPCPAPWDKYQTMLNVATVEDLSVLFGDSYLYSRTGKMKAIGVWSEPADNLFYKKDKIEYMPELFEASWRDEFQGLDVWVNIIKKRFSLRGSGYEYKTTTNGRDYYGKKDRDFIGCCFNYEQSWYEVRLHFPKDEILTEEEEKLIEEALVAYIEQLS